MWNSVLCPVELHLMPSMLDGQRYRKEEVMEGCTSEKMCVRKLLVMVKGDWKNYKNYDERQTRSVLLDASICCRTSARDERCS